MSSCLFLSLLPGIKTCTVYEADRSELNGAKYENKLNTHMHACCFFLLKVMIFLDEIKLCPSQTYTIHCTNIRQATVLDLHDICGGLSYHV